MDLNLGVFQEPRGVMRIFQFIFSICAFAITSSGSFSLIFKCATQHSFTFEYPFNIMMDKQPMVSSPSCNSTATIMGDYSSDARYFVATGVISMLYCIACIILYTKYDEKYKTNSRIPQIDFLATVFIGVLWLSSSASWANSLSGIKHITDPSNIIWGELNPKCPECPVADAGFSSLNISVIFGFLNFFLWAADLWFLYKETSWFQGRSELPGPN